MSTKTPPQSPPKTAFAIFVQMCREEHALMYPEEILGKNSKDENFSLKSLDYSSREVSCCR